MLGRLCLHILGDDIEERIGGSQQRQTNRLGGIRTTAAARRRLFTGVVGRGGGLVTTGAYCQQTQEHEREGNALHRSLPSIKIWGMSGLCCAA